jgi:(S)-sulfolactate dehydrogenase
LQEKSFMSAVLITEFMDSAAIELLRAKVEVFYEPDLHAKPKEIALRIKNMQGLIVRNRTQVTAQILQEAKQLKVVGRLGVGLDNIDLDAAKAQNIWVAPATGANALSVAEYVMQTLLSLHRPISHGQAAMLQGNWPRTEMIGQELAGKVLGLIGFGEIARLVAHKARAFNMSVAYFDPFIKETFDDAKCFDSIEGLLAYADSVSLHVPLNDLTRHLIDAARLKVMKPGAFLVNTARGGVINEPDLVASINQGHLGGAALDVFEHEPLNAEHGAMFKDVKNLILTPHSAGVTHESNERVSELTAQNVLQALGHA